MFFIFHNRFEQFKFVKIMMNLFVDLLNRKKKANLKLIFVTRDSKSLCLIAVVKIYAHTHTLESRNENRKKHDLIFSIEIFFFKLRTKTHRQRIIR